MKAVEPKQAKDFLLHGSPLKVVEFSGQGFDVVLDDVLDRRVNVTTQVDSSNHSLTAFTLFKGELDGSDEVRHIELLLFGDTHESAEVIHGQFPRNVTTDVVIVVPPVPTVVTTTNEVVMMVDDVVFFSSIAGDTPDVGHD